MVQDANWHIILSWLDKDITYYLLLFLPDALIKCACVDSLCYVEGVSVEFVLKRRYIILQVQLPIWCFLLPVCRSGVRMRTARLRQRREAPADLLLTALPSSLPAPPWLRPLRIRRGSERDRRAHDPRIRSETSGREPVRLHCAS